MSSSILIRRSIIHSFEGGVVVVIGTTRHLLYLGEFISDVILVIINYISHEKCFFSNITQDIDQLSEESA